jgi:hypothetical protein
MLIGQQLGLELSNLPGGFDTRLFADRLTVGVKGPQGLGRPSGSVQRDGKAAPGALVEGAPPGPRRQGRQHLLLPVEIDHHLVETSRGLVTACDQIGTVLVEEGFVWQIGERLTRSDRQGPVQELSTQIQRRWWQASLLIAEGCKELRIDTIVADHQGVAIGLAGDIESARDQMLPQTGNEDLQARSSVSRTPLAPQTVDEPVSGQPVGITGGERGQHHLLLARLWAISIPQPDRPKHSNRR